MRLYYLSAAEIPGRRAISIQQVRMCEAFAKAGADVRLIHPFYIGASGITADWRSFYGIRGNFNKIALPSLMGYNRTVGRLPRGVGTASMAASFAVYLSALLATGKLGSHDVVYSRNIYAVRVLLKIMRMLRIKHRPRIGVELHRCIEAPAAWMKEVLQHADVVVAITHALAREIKKEYMRDDSIIHVEADGVDIARFTASKEKTAVADMKRPAQCRATALYAGHLYRGRGIETIIDCARRMAHVYFLIVGGFPDDIAYWRSYTQGKYPNVNIAGFVEPHAIPAYLRSADVLLAPYTSAVATISHASPLKVFEYMAAAKPIVISNFPVFHEVMTDGVHCLFMAENDPQDMAQKIEQILSDAHLATSLGNNAFEKAQHYTWENRASRILKYFDGQKYHDERPPQCIAGGKHD